MYFTSSNNTDGQSQAYGYTAALSPQTSMMTSARDFDTGRVRFGNCLPRAVYKYQAHEAQCFHGQGARHTYAEVEVREPREPFPSQIPRTCSASSEYEDLLYSSTRTIDTRHGQWCQSWWRVWSSDHKPSSSQLNSKALTWDTRVKSRGTLMALRFEHLLNRDAKLLPKEGQEDVKGYAAPLCIQFPAGRDQC